MYLFRPRSETVIDIGDGAFLESFKAINTALRIRQRVAFIVCKLTTLQENISAEILPRNHTSEFLALMLEANRRCNTEDIFCLGF